MAEDEESWDELPPEAAKAPEGPVVDWGLFAKFIAQHFKEVHLIEMTPEEVDQARRRAYGTLREKMLERGVKLPDDDNELFFLLRRILQ